MQKETEQLAIEIFSPLTPLYKMGYDNGLHYFRYKRMLHQSWTVHCLRLASFESNKILLVLFEK